MEFLHYFAKSKRNLIIVFDSYTFNNLFSLLLNEKMSHADALTFILANCELNAYVFQECIHGGQYLQLQPKKIGLEEAGRRSFLHKLALSYME